MCSAAAGLVEGAILGAVAIAGAAACILTGGPQGHEAAEVPAAAVLRASSYSAEIGRASTFKMRRSIFSRGVEELWADISSPPPVAP